MPTQYRFVQMRSVWLAITFCLGLAIPANAVTIFSEDYEVANMGALAAHGWTEIFPGTERDGTPTMSIVPAPPGRTGLVLRMQYQGNHDSCCPPASNDNNNALIARTFNAGPEVWERYYVRYEPINPGQPTGFSGSAKQHYFNNDTTPNYVTDFLNSNPQMLIVNQTSNTHICPPGASGFPGGDVSCNLNPSLNGMAMSYNAWHCIETHLNQTTAELWIDGIQTMRYTTGVFGPSNYNRIQVYRQGSDNMYRYEDDFVLATTRVGCSGSPSVDITPPLTPLGLTIR